VSNPGALCLTHVSPRHCSHTPLHLCRRYGLIGPNGCGKSCLLKSLAAREVAIPNHIDIYYLDREVAASDETALDCVKSVDEERVRLEKESEKLMEQEMAPEVEQRLEDIYEKCAATRRACSWRSPQLPNWLLLSLLARTRQRVLPAESPRPPQVLWAVCDIRPQQWQAARFRLRCCQPCSRSRASEGPSAPARCSTYVADVASNGTACAHA
jgi:ABC transporter